MRFTFHLTPNKQLVPYTYPHHLTGALHKLAGWNNVHDEISCYSLGWLNSRNVQSTGEGLHFPSGAQWSISIYDGVLAKRVRQSAELLPTVAFGMRIYQIEEQPTPAFGNVYRFEVGSPVLVRAEAREDGTRKHLVYSDPEADAYLTQTLRTKLNVAGFSGAHLDVLAGFDRSYNRAKTKLVEIKGIKFKCSFCPVVVAGTPEAVQFAWEVGAGHLTGSGFGFLK
jgi:CRISPR-associated endoribonuclease Cas6